jgi:O-antigen/teichoic acid export membrane protein
VSRESSEASGRSSYAESAAFALLSFAAVAVIALVSSVLTARLYGVEAVGAYALALAPAGICMALSTMQEQAALGRELATLRPREARVTTLFLAVQLFSSTLTLVVAAVVGAIAAVLFAGPIDRPDLIAVMVALLAAYLLLDNTSWNLDVVFAAFRAGRHLFWVRLIHSVGFLALAVALSFALDDAWGLALAQIGAAAAALAARLTVIGRHMSLRVTRDQLRDGLRAIPAMVRFGAKLAPSFLAEGVAHESATSILGLTTSIAGVGAWSRVWFLVKRLSEPGWRIGEVLFPTLMQHHASGERAAFDRTLVTSARYVAIGLLLPAAAGAGASAGIMQVFGPEFVVGADALAVLLLVPPLYCVLTLQGQALTVLNRPLTVTWLTVVRAVVMVAAGAALSVRFGITGMAAGWLLGYAVDLVLRTVTVRRCMVTPITRIWPPRSMLALAAAYAAGFAAARAVDAALGLAGVVVALAAGAAAFALAYAAAGGLTQEDRSRLSRLRARLARRSARGAPVTAD